MPTPRSSWSPSSATPVRPASSSSTPIPAASPPARACVEAYEAAFACDTVSAFGGIIAVNRPLDARDRRGDRPGSSPRSWSRPTPTRRRAPSSPRKKNLRLLLTGDAARSGAAGPGAEVDRRRLCWSSRATMAGSARDDLKVVTKRAPTEQELADCLFAWTVAKHVKSNAIVYAKDGATAGIGAGQMNRLESARIAAWKAQGRGREGRLGRAAHDRLGGRLGRLLPLRRRPARRGRGGRDGGDPARRLDPRRGGDRRRRRGRPGDGLHRHAPLPPLEAAVGRVSGRWRSSAPRPSSGGTAPGPRG